MPHLLLLLLIGCSSNETGEVFDYTLTLTPVTAPNQSPFDGLVRLDLVIEPEVGESQTVSLDAEQLEASGNPQFTGLGALENATLAIEGYDDSRMFSFGRSDPISLEQGEAEVRVLVSETDRFAWFNSLDTASFAGAMASDGQGRFVLFGGNTGGVSPTTEEDVVDTVWAVDVAPPGEAFTLIEVGSMPARDDGESLRMAHTATLLSGEENAGLIFVAAGNTAYFQSQTALADAFIWDPVAQETVSQIPLIRKRFFHQAVENQAGHVLLFGGMAYARAGAIGIETSIEIVDPSTGDSELAIGNTQAGYLWPAVASIGASGVLFCGGVADQASGLTGTAACDLVSNSGEIQGGYVALEEPLMNASLVQLGEDKALLTGGLVTTGLDDVNDYIEVPASNRAWIIEDGSIREVGEMHLARGAHGSARLPDGRVIVFGGLNEGAAGLYPSGTNALACAEIFDPADDTFYLLEPCEAESTADPLPSQTAFPIFASDPLYGLLTVGGLNPSGRTDGDASTGVAYFVSCPDADQC